METRFWRSPLAVFRLHLEHEAQSFLRLGGELAATYVNVPLGEPERDAGNLSRAGAGHDAAGALLRPLVRIVSQQLQEIDCEGANFFRRRAERRSQRRAQLQIRPVGVTRYASLPPAPDERTLVEIVSCPRNRHVAPDWLLGMRPRNNDLLEFVLWFRFRFLVGVNARHTERMKNQSQERQRWSTAMVDSDGAWWLPNQRIER